MLEGVRLGAQARSAMLAGEVQVSSVSVWENAVKSAAGRPDVPAVESLLETDDFPELVFTSAHARAAGAMQAYDVALLDATR